MENFTNSNMRQAADQKSPKSKAGRNDPCPCGSGKKYKKCCLNNDNNYLSINRSIPHQDIQQFEQFYDEQNSWLDQELANRNSTEIAYDDVVLACLRNGSSIKESLQAANAKYPAEALQINENNLTDIRDHYEYLLNHLIIKDKFKTVDKSRRQLSGNMDTVNFINCKESDDLIVSFSFDEGTEFGIEGFMIHRCLKYEFILKPYERGPSVAWTTDDEIILVKSVKIDPRRVEIETTRAKYLFDLSKISNEDYQAAIRVLMKMNFDGIYNLEIE